MKPGEPLGGLGQSSIDACAAKAGDVLRASALRYLNIREITDLRSAFAAPENWNNTWSTSNGSSSPSWNRSIAPTTCVTTSDPASLVVRRHRLARLSTFNARLVARLEADLHHD